MCACCDIEAEQPTQDDSGIKVTYGSSRLQVPAPSSKTATAPATAPAEGSTCKVHAEVVSNDGIDITGDSEPDFDVTLSIGHFSVTNGEKTIVSEGNTIEIDVNGDGELDTVTRTGDTFTVDTGDGSIHQYGITGTGSAPAPAPAADPPSVEDDGVTVDPDGTIVVDGSASGTIEVKVDVNGDDILDTVIFDSARLLVTIDLSADKSGPFYHRFIEEGVATFGESVEGGVAGEPSVRIKISPLVSDRL